ncbi:MAG: hypothetical protein JO256_13190 [Alphaproteobacteria bacterium]|nr:hypothetical protein [Alphaproteobacteria bacterium]
MKAASLFIVLCLVLTLPAAAQGPLPRLKGRIIDFDGLTFHLAPEKGPPLAIRLQARTQFMTMTAQSLSAIKAGAYAGATVTMADGTLTAEEVHLYPDALRGSSEGRISLDGSRFVVSGAVTAVVPGSLTLFYRGARMVNGVCDGRGGGRSGAGTACTGDDVIKLTTQTRITALAPTDRRLLIPGAIATVTIATDAKGNRSTPGLILEKP